MKSTKARAVELRRAVSKGLEGRDIEGVGNADLEFQKALDFLGDYELARANCKQVNASSLTRDKDELLRLQQEERTFRATLGMCKNRLR